MNNNLHFNNFAVDYGRPGTSTNTPSGSNSLVARMGIFLSGTYAYDNRYFGEFSYRRSGSSQFGANNKYAPFWSVGAGWNIHRESFLEDSEIFQTLRLRYSYGVTGSVAFSSYQAMTTYNYATDNYYWNGIGALPITMGNEDLKWQTTKQNNIGINGNMFNNRLSFTIDYYNKITEDMLVTLSIPSSVGVASVKDNLGRMKNSGIEFDVAGLLVQNKDWRVMLTVNGAHNKNEILAISSGLDKYNDENMNSGGSPRFLYKEGESTTAIYAVPSMGINPYNGNEIFIASDGSLTEIYDANDKVAVGDLTPDLQGTIIPNIQYRNLSLLVAMSYQFGGKLYNLTRANNVENVNPYYNVDRRAFEERWVNPGDIVAYRNIADDSSRAHIHTTRFVEDDNLLSISRVELAYEFNTNTLKNLGLSRLRIGAGMTDVARISSVYYERGTSYPFARGFTFSLSATF